MKFVKILEVHFTNQDVTFKVVADDEKAYTFTLTPEVTMSMAGDLIKAATSHKETNPNPHGFLLEVAGCQPFLADEGQSGIALLTRGALELALILSEKNRTALRECIDQLDSGEILPPKKGPKAVH